MRPAPPATSTARRITTNKLLDVSAEGALETYASRDEHSAAELIAAFGEALGVNGGWKRLRHEISEVTLTSRKDFVERVCRDDAQLWQKVVDSQALETELMDLPRIHLGF